MSNLALHSPFPGMDPWLEHPQLWTGVHSRLIVYISDLLQPLLAPRYIANVEERVYVEEPGRVIRPDVWIRPNRPQPVRASSAALAELDEPLIVEAPLDVHEPFIEIIDLSSGRQVVTVIEVVSPSNKFAGPGQDLYLTKQRDVLQSTAHLVEIDLLRAGPHALAVPLSRIASKGKYDYLVSVNRASRLRRIFDTYPRTIRDRLPRIGIPLHEPDTDVQLDLQAALDQTYSAGRYAERIDYSRSCEPPLSPEDEAWADQLVRAWRAE
jgi:hypothetical protein